MSEMPWYKAVQDSNNLMAQPMAHTPIEPPKRMKRYKPFVPDQFYVMPEKRITTTRITKHRDETVKKSSKKTTDESVKAVSNQMSSDRQLLLPVSTYLNE